MKFEYSEDSKEDRGEPVAYLDQDGDLVMQDYQGDAICLMGDGMPESGFRFQPDHPDNERKFYMGDTLTVTITF